MTVLAFWIGGGLAGLVQFAPFLLILVTVYFLMIAGPQKKQKAWQEMLGGLKPGDRVTTSGGLKGTVLQVRDSGVTLRVQPDGLKLEFDKAAISAVVTEESKA